MAEVLHGTSSGESLSVSADKTQVYGLKGNDTISSNNKSNVLLIGGSGNDSFVMSGGNGTLSGGAGKDTFEFHYSSTAKLSAVIEDIDPVNDKIIVDSGTMPQLTHSIIDNDVVWRDSNGYFELTLKGSGDASDYYEGTAHEYVWDVLKLVNGERENQGLNWLTLSQALTDGAAIRSKEIIDLFSHTRPNDTSCFTVVTKSYWSMGENIAGGYTSPEAVMTGWMNSTGHRANILNESFQKIGVGYTYNSESDYKYNWVQMFGSGLMSPETVSTSELLKTPFSVKDGSDYYAVTPSEGDEVINYTDNTVIYTLDGNNTVYNHGDDVTIYAGDGNDYIDNSGDDYSGRGGENVSINGGAGNDYIKNDGDSVYICGDDGNDTIQNIIHEIHTDHILEEIYTPNNVTINAGKGNDFIYNAGHNVSINGGEGDDYIKHCWAQVDGFEDEYFRPDNATISGGKGNDTISLDEITESNIVEYNAGDGNDSVAGFNETSTLSIGGAAYSKEIVGSDIIVTVGDGKITLVGAASLSALNIDGEEQITTLTLTNDDAAKQTLAAQIVTADASARTKAIRIVGNALDNSILGGTGKDTIYSKNGDDYLAGGKGNDKLYGQSGDDTLYGGSGNDTLSGGLGEDLFIYSAGNDVITDYEVGEKISLGADVSNASLNGNDAVFIVGKNKLTVKNAKYKELTLIDAAGNETTRRVGAATFDNDAAAKVTLAADVEFADASSRTKAIRIVGNELDNSILGGTGKDTFYGGNGDDYLAGGAGADKLYGQNGNDTLWGGLGNDTLNGGDGADKFIYEDGDGKDVISGFDNNDMLLITGAFTASYDKASDTIAFKVGTGSITLKDFTATTFNVNGCNYRVKGSKLVK